MRLAALICLLLLCPVAARAGQAAPTQTFLLSVTGATTAVWDHTERRTGTCATTVRSEGSRTVRFVSQRPTLVRFVGSRISPVNVRNLVGVATIRGRQTITSDCGSTNTTPCPKTTVRVVGGSTRLTPSAAGVAVGQATAKMRRPDCLSQPTDVAAMPLGPGLTPLRISSRSLANTGIAKLTLTVTATRRKTYGEGEGGTSDQRSKWTLTFVRTGR